MRRALLITGFWLAACSSPAPEKKTTAPPPLPVKDDSSLLLTEHRTGARIVQNHLLDLAAMPGGTIGDYEDHGKKYQLFIIESDTPDNAAFLLLDFKAALTNPEYLAYIGGYFGADAGKPVYVFARLKYLAGVAGLDKADADPIARELAARLR